MKADILLVEAFVGQFCVTTSSAFMYFLCKVLKVHECSSLGQAIVNESIAGVKYDACLWRLHQNE